MGPNDGGPLVVQGIEDADWLSLHGVSDTIVDAVAWYMNNELTSAELSRVTFTVTATACGASVPPSGPAPRRLLRLPRPFRRRGRHKKQGKGLLRIVDREGRDALCCEAAKRWPSCELGGTGHQPGTACCAICLSKSANLATPLLRIAPSTASSSPVLKLCALKRLAFIRHAAGVMLSLMVSN